MANSNARLEHVFLVMPAFNEAGAIAATLDEVLRFLPPRQVIVVDDASTDATAALARDKGVQVVRHALNRGQGAALATGFEAARRGGAKIIVTFDADGQHRADDLPILVEPIQRGEADVVLGSRFLGTKPPQMPPLRRLMLRLGTVFTRFFSGIKVTDTHNGFRALSADATRIIHIRQDRMAHASELLDQVVRHRLRYVERPVEVRYSAYSLAKGQRNRDALKIMIRLLLDKVSL